MINIILIIAGIGLFSISSPATNDNPSGDRPNLIFILADDWGLGDVNTYGGDRCKVETPHMDQLARDGMKFTDAHSSSSVCTPTRYSILTGRYNWRSTLKNFVLRGFSPALIKQDRLALPAFLKQNGYATGCIGKWHLGMDFPTTDGKPPQSTAETPEELADKCNVNWNGVIQNGPTSIGFDYFWGISASLDMPPYIWIENDRFVGECTTIKAFFKPNRAGPAHPDFEDHKVLPTLTKKAKKYVRKHAKTSEPFFLYLALNSPHTPISPSKAFQGKSTLGPYGDFIMETDWAIGEVIKAVEASNIAENTMIIVTADNGTSPAATRNGKSQGIQFRTGKAEPFDPAKHYSSDIYRGHKADIYEGGHRVPFIVRYDGKVKPGSINSDSICLVDIFATYADILGAEIPDNAAEDSVSLLPHLIDSDKNSRHEAIVHHSVNGSFAIRKGKWKLNFCPGSGGWSDPSPQQLKSEEINEWVQLFDLFADPAETRNLASKHPKKVTELTQLMRKYIENGRSTPGDPQQNDGTTHLYPKWIREGRSP